MADDTLPRLTGVIRDILAPDDPITPDSAIMRDLGADSLEVIELTMAIEDEFRIEISTADMDTAATLADLAALVDAKRAAVAGTKTGAAG